MANRIDAEIPVDNNVRPFAVIADTDGNLVAVNSNATDVSLKAYNGTNYHPAGIDAATRALNTIEYEHHEVHAGSSFTCYYTQTVSDTGDKSIISFLTASGTKYLHITASASATAVANACIIEAPTITDNTGATLTVSNRRRIGTPTASSVLDTSQNPDLAGSATYFTEATQGNVTSGTILAQIPIGSSGAGPIKAVGGLARSQQEWILKPATLYAFVVESLSDADNIHWIELDWYEHTDQAT